LQEASKQKDKRNDEQCFLGSQNTSTTTQLEPNSNQKPGTDSTHQFKKKNNTTQSPRDVPCTTLCSTSAEWATRQSTASMKHIRRISKFAPPPNLAYTHQLQSSAGCCCHQHEGLEAVLWHQICTGATSRYTATWVQFEPSCLLVK
jgi:hypothetical protein